jgi:hypothetical protein
MIKMLFAFILLFSVFFFGIKTLTSTSKEDRKEMLKITGYSIMCSAITMVTMTLIVLFF